MGSAAIFSTSSVVFTRNGVNVRTRFRMPANRTSTRVHRCILCPITVAVICANPSAGDGIVLIGLLTTVGSFEISAVSVFQLCGSDRHVTIGNTCTFLRCLVSYRCGSNVANNNLTIIDATDICSASCCVKIAFTDIQSTLNNDLSISYCGSIIGFPLQSGIIMSSSYIFQWLRTID